MSLEGFIGKSEDFSSFGLKVQKVLLNLTQCSDQQISFALHHAVNSQASKPQKTICALGCQSQGWGLTVTYLWLVGNGRMVVIVVMIVPYSSIPY